MAAINARGRSSGTPRSAPPTTATAASASARTTTRAPAGSRSSRRRRATAPTSSGASWPSASRRARAVGGGSAGSGVRGAGAAASRRPGQLDARPTGQGERWRAGSAAGTGDTQDVWAGPPPDSPSGSVLTFGRYRAGPSARSPAATPATSSGSSARRRSAATSAEIGDILRRTAAVGVRVPPSPTPSLAVAGLNDRRHWHEPDRTTIIAPNASNGRDSDPAGRPLAPCGRDGPLAGTEARRWSALRLLSRRSARTSTMGGSSPGGRRARSDRHGCGPPPGGRRLARRRCGPRRPSGCRRRVGPPF